jgi:hypothetical protein
MTFSDRYDQFAENSTPTFSAPLPAWQWEMPRAWQRTGRSGGGRPVLWGTAGTAGASGGGGVAPAGQGFIAETAGDRFQKRWRESEARAERMRQQYEGTCDWSGSPQDYEDVLGPERSGGLDKVVNGPKQTGQRKDEGWDPGSVPVRPKPTNGNGKGLSGGAAKVPSTISSGW